MHKLHIKLLLGFTLLELLLISYSNTLYSQVYLKTRIILTEGGSPAFRSAISKNLTEIMQEP